VVIGAKTFTEQYILADVLGGRVQARTGLATDVVSSLGSTVAFDALAQSQIDVYVDYSGTIWATIMHRDTLPEDRALVLRDVGDYLREEHGVLLVCALGFENAYAFAMRRDEAGSLGVRTLSELGPRAPGLSIGADYEFFARPEWQSIEETYGLEFASRRSMDSSLMYQAVAHGEVDVITAFSTDGRIAAFDLALLEDDRGAIPPYDAVVLASPRLQREHPEAVAALRELSGTIDAGRMRRMNLAVDQRGETPSAVAARFLESLGSR
jgi:osmoprotectant transport system substrate-binding protein/osmoprotectant transport system permease protein